MLNYLNKELQPYTNKEEYKKLFKEYTTSGDLFVHIDELTKKLVIEYTKLHETKSDSAYWGVMSNICLYEDLRCALIAIAFDKLRHYDCKAIEPYLFAKDRLDEIISNKEQVIKDLLKYKPSGYKSKIELLEDIFKNE